MLYEDELVREVARGPLFDNDAPEYEVPRVDEAKIFRVAGCGKYCQRRQKISDAVAEPCRNPCQYKAED